VRSWECSLLGSSGSSSAGYPPSPTPLFFTAPFLGFSTPRKKIPHECKSQRNCQLLMVTAAIALTVHTLPHPLSDFLLLSSLLFLCAVGLLLQQVCRLGRSLRRNHPRHHLRCDGPDERARQCLLQGPPPPLLSSFSHHTSHCLSVWFLLSLSVCAVQWGLRILSLFLFGTSFGWALYTMLHNMHPSRDNFDLYDENDDWGHS
jgi:hypothetical protein